MENNENPTLQVNEGTQVIEELGIQKPINPILSSQVEKQDLFLKNQRGTLASVEEGATK